MQSGIEHVVASAGTAFTPEQAKLLSRYGERVVVVYDADQAGSAATLRGIDVLLAADLEVRVISLPEGHDPDSFVRAEGSDRFLRLLEDAQPILDYKLSHLARSHDLSTVEGKRRAIEQLVETLSLVNDEIRRNLLVKEVSERLGVDEEVLHRATRGKRRRGRAARDEGLGTRSLVSDEEELRMQPGSAAERELVRLMLSDSEIAARMADEVRAENFQEGPYRRIAEGIFEILKTHGKPDPGSLMDRFQGSDLVGVISRLASEGFDEKHVEQSLADSIAQLRREKALRAIEAVRLELKTAEQRGDDELVGALYQKLILLRKEA